MKKFEEMLTKADFSRETDLKERLRAKLFGEKKVIPFPILENAVALDMESLEGLAAAGYTVAEEKNHNEN